ncbi:FISUMP domain-containing protein [Mucilaginibacter defluvii]|uniref:Fibrobacter succinogenes major paralogous domain-containing protein n=1 Tax=Mucilaginibacter defluvii TaxID=1196019 RepID=A0ABP9FYE9_9SPHI
MKPTLRILIAAMLIIGSCKNDDSKEVIPKKDETAIAIDGKQYPTVKIGTQLWTAVNYEGTGGVKYDQMADMENSGKLYTLNEAKTIKPPTGWRLPTKEDYLNLMNYVGKTSENSGGIYLQKEDALKFMATKTWFTKGINSLGFNAVSTGAYDGYFKQYDYSGRLAVFWTTSWAKSSDNTTNLPVCFSIYDHLSDDATYVLIHALQNESSRHAVRFIKN